MSAAATTGASAAASCSRLRPLATPGGRPSALEAAVLVAFGAVIALTGSLVVRHLGLPGHHILMVLPPLALGLALVPRAHAGKLMSGTAVLATLGVRLLGHGGAGPGALVATALAGPAFDLACARARGGPGVYLALVVAGLAANTGAFAVRALARVLGPGASPLRETAWWALAPFTYPLLGALAGLACAALLFRPRP